MQFCQITVQVVNQTVLVLIVTRKQFWKKNCKSTGCSDRFYFHEDDFKAQFNYSVLNNAGLNNEYKLDQIVDELLIKLNLVLLKDSDF